MHFKGGQLCARIILLCSLIQIIFNQSVKSETYFWVDIPRGVERCNIVFRVCRHDFHAKEDAGEEVDAGGPNEDQPHYFE